MPSIPRYRPTVAGRRVSNDVGAAVWGPQKILEADEPIPVRVMVWWDDDEEPTPVEGQCLGWTAECVHVEVRDRLTDYKYRAWVPAADVTRLLF